MNNQEPNKNPEPKSREARNKEKLEASKKHKEKVINTQQIITK